MERDDVTDLVTPEVWDQTCYACRFAAFNENGTWCIKFSENILNEALAGADCPEFISADGKAYVNVDPQ